MVFTLKLHPSSQAMSLSETADSRKPFSASAEHSPAELRDARLEYQRGISVIAALQRETFAIAELLMMDARAVAA
jgi:hypothetical protein